MEGFQIENIIEGLMVAATICFVAYSPVFRAIGKRIMHGKIPPEGVPLTLDDPRVDQISGEMAAMRHMIEEQQERLDFAERMLAQARERSSLGPGKNG